MAQVSLKDLEGFVSVNELASRPMRSSAKGHVRLNMIVKPVEGTIRYEIVVKNQPNIAIKTWHSIGIKNLSYALELFNDVEQYEENLSVMDLQISSANKFR